MSTGPIEQAAVRFVGGTLVIAGEPHQPPRVPFPNLWKWDARILAWSANANSYFQCHLDEKFRNAYRDEVPSWPDVQFAKYDQPELRDYQKTAASEWFAHECAGILNLATGLGKSNIALSIMHELGCSTLIVAPIRDLMYQWHHNIKRALGYDAGIIGDNFFTVRPVSVTTYKSAYIHMHTLGNRFRMVVFDECHHLPSGEMANAALMSAAPFRLGLSATITPAQEQKLRPLIGSVVHREDGHGDAKEYLAKCQVVHVPVELESTTRQKYQELGKVISSYCMDRRAEDDKWRWQDIHKDKRKNPEARRVWRASRIRRWIEERAPEKLRVVEDLLELHGNGQVVIFTASNASAFDVSRRFLIPCILSHCGGPERAEILAGLKSGKYRAIVANECLDEGVDVPMVKTAISLGGRKGTRQSIQRLGRVLRLDGEQKAVFFDVFCESTGEETRAKVKRSARAFQSSVHRRIQK